MKRTMLLVVAFVIALLPRAQETEADYAAVREEMKGYFQDLDLSGIKSGILSDYGIHLVYPDPYNGVPTDTNYVDFTVWKALYAGLYDSKVNENCKLADPEEVFAGLESSGSVAIMDYNYSEISEDAVEQGTVVLENDRIRIKSNSIPPYVESTCFAVAPISDVYDGRLVSFSFSKSSFFSNTSRSISKIEVSFEPGASYQVAQLGNVVSYIYDSNGDKEVSFRMTFSDGKVLTSKTIITVQEVVQKKKWASQVPTKQIETFKTIAGDHLQGGGRIQVMYMDKNLTKGKFIRPLIIVEDMDLSVLSKSLAMDLETLGNISGMGDALAELSKAFDIIYIDFKEGLDSPMNNGEFLRKAIKEINANRYLLSDESYIIGLGVGGVISRIGVNLMEENDEKHRVKKIVSINSPFRGLNIPVGIQSVIRQIGGLEGLVDKFDAVLGKKARDLIDVLDSDVMKSLMIYRVTGYNEYSNENNASFLRKYDAAIKLPKDCESVSITNGSVGYDNNRLYDTYSELFNLNIKKKGIDAWIFGNGGVGFDIWARTLPNKINKQIYWGRLYAYARILFWNIHYPLNDFSVFSDPTMHPIDCMSGASLNTSLISNMHPYLNGIMKVDKFCLVPTFSALDIDGDKYETGSWYFLKDEVPFDRYYVSDTNGDYTNPTNLVSLLVKEMTPQIRGNYEDLLGPSELWVDNVPDMALVKCDWKFMKGNFKVASKSGARATIVPLHYGDSTDLVSVSVSIPFVDFKYEVPGVVISSKNVEISGSTWISKDANIYSLSGYTRDNIKLEWEAAEGIELHPIGNSSVSASATKIVENPWIVAKMTADNVDYTFRKELCLSKLDTVEFEMLDSWWDKDSLCHKYILKVNCNPGVIEHFRFCWDNTVNIYDRYGNLIKEDSDESNNTGGIMVKDPIYVGINMGQAKIRTTGSVSKSRLGCFPSFEHVFRDSTYSKIQIDSVSMIHRDGVAIIGGGQITPSSINPDGTIQIDPFHPHPFVPEEDNYATIKMPCVDSDQIAKGSIRCSVYDDFGTVKTASIYVESKWKQVYHSAPNPANTVLTVTAGDGGSGVGSRMSAMSANRGGIVKLLLYNDMTLVRSAEFDESQAKMELNVADLPDGNYYLNVMKDGEVVHRGIVVVKH